MPIDFPLWLKNSTWNWDGNSVIIGEGQWQAEPIWCTKRQDEGEPSGGMRSSWGGRESTPAKPKEVTCLRWRQRVRREALSWHQRGWGWRVRAGGRGTGKQDLIVHVFKLKDEPLARQQSNHKNFICDHIAVIVRLPWVELETGSGRALHRG